MHALLTMPATSMLLGSHAVQRLVDFMARGFYFDPGQPCCKQECEKLIMNLLEGFAAGARALYMVVKLICGAAVGTPAVLVHMRSNAYQAFRGWRDNSYVQNCLIQSVASEHDDISKPVLTFSRLRNLKSTLRATFSHRLLRLGFFTVRAETFVAPKY